MEDRSTIEAEATFSEATKDVGGDAVDSVTLARLLEEVRNADAAPQPTAYNRMHNRHNRS